MVIRDEGLMKAKAWFERGIQEADPFNAFSNFWRGFNNLFSDNGKSPERDKIKAFLSYSLSETEAGELLQSHESEIAHLLSKPVIDMRGNGKDTLQNIQAFNSATTSMEMLQELFMVIYQVRCNLEHGKKLPGRERDEQLCRSGSSLMADIVGRVCLSEKS